MNNNSFVTYYQKDKEKPQKKLIKGIFPRKKNKKASM